MIIRKKSVAVTISTILIVVILWAGGIIPNTIGRISSSLYVGKNYKDLNLEFVTMDFSPAHGSYLAVYEDKDGNRVNFLMESRWLPIMVWSDPIQQQ